LEVHTPLAEGATIAVESAEPVSHIQVTHVSLLRVSHCSVEQLLDAFSWLSPDARIDKKEFPLLSFAPLQVEQKFLAAGGVVTKKSRGKAKKDPNAPKKPSNAYMRCLQDNRQQIVDSLPEGQRGVAAVAKAAGVQWKQVSEDEKRRYQDLVEAAKVEYQKQLEEYSARAA